MKKFLTIAAVFLTALSGCQDKPDDPIVEKLQTPSGVVLHSSTETSLTFQWSMIPEATAYNWRLTEVGNGQQKTGTTSSRNVQINDLKKGTGYLFSVCAVAKDREIHLMKRLLLH